MATDNIVLSRKDGSLDAFINTYCAGQGIEVDGDLFGVLFSGHELWTAEEAARALNKAKNDAMLNDFNYPGSRHHY